MIYCSRKEQEKITIQIFTKLFSYSIVGAGLFALRLSLQSFWLLLLPPLRSLFYDFCLFGTVVLILEKKIRD